ncbi:MAG: hypothetical protein JEZ06_03895 [Anaerolineaceae bacterium]|nr:hypothetical protein [Anaerolineaceae bacterium]
MNYNKIILVTRKTRLEGLIKQFNTREQARFYIEHNGGDFNFYIREHDVYFKALDQLHTQLKSISKLHMIERSFLPNFLFSDKDVVVTIGIDGLVVNTAKYLDGQPIIAVNPDPQNIDGILLPFNVSQGVKAVQRTMEGKHNFQPISMAQATLQDGQSLLAFNDLFIGVNNHTSARYQITSGRRSENQSSSGIIISTGAGFTGWLSSFINMTNGLLKFSGDEETAPLSYPQLPWDTDKLFFIVREPFISKTSRASIVCGYIDSQNELILESHTPSDGVIFSDGIASDFLAFNSGSIVKIKTANKRTILVTT